MAGDSSASSERPRLWWVLIAHTDPARTRAAATVSSGQANWASSGAGGAPGPDTRTTIDVGTELR